MSTTELNDRPTLAPAVQSVLGALRRRIRQYVWLEGCAAAVAWLGLAFWATLAVDWLFEPPPMVREAMLAVIFVVLAAIVLRLIGRRAFVRITNSNAAMVLERRFPELGDSLLTAVGECSPHTPCADSMAEKGVCEPQSVQSDEIYRDMLARTCREAAARIADVDLKQVFNPRPLWLKLVAGGLLTLSVALFAVLLPDGFGVWARRMLLMSDELWPRSTRLEVEGFPDGVQKVARGADVEVVVRADATMPQVPQVVEVRYRTQGGSRGRATMERRGVARGPEDRFQEYAYTFRSVLADIHFDIVGGDDRVADRRIEVVDSPTVSQMMLDCELPPYIGRREPPLPVSGVMQIPVGSRVTVRAGAANKDLAHVQVNTIVADSSASVASPSQDVAQPPSAVQNRSAQPRAAVPQAVEAAISADRRGFSYTLEPLRKDVTLLFSLTDTDGIRSRDPVRLTLVPLPDQPPQMAVQLDGIGTAVTPQARIPAVGRIADDYGLGRVWFEHAVDQQKPGLHAIREFPRGANDHPTDFKLAEAALELRELGLKPAQKLSVCVKAADLCDLGHGPNVSSSDRWTLDVVTPEQLRVMLESRELVLRQRFDGMIQEMTETRDLLARLEFTAPPAAAPAAKPTAAPTAKPTAVATKTPPAGSNRRPEPGDEEPSDSPARQHALRLLRVEGALTNCRKSTQEVLGLAEAFDDIRKQLVNNRVDTEELKNRLQGGIADPLRTIATAMFPELEHRLDGLQAALDDLRRGPGLRDQAQQQADEILLAMRKVRDRMIELEDFNEALDLLRGIIKTQEQLRDETQQRHKQKIRELLKE